MSAKKQEPSRYREVRNAKARRDYEIEETLEAGLVLTGTEVKAIRAGLAQINDSFVRFDKERPIMYHSHIAEYSHGSYANHNPYRPRPLLLNRREIHRWKQQIEAGGRAVVPLRMYFKHGLVKVELGLGKGKKHYDKREDLKKHAVKRETERHLSDQLRRSRGI